MIFKMLHTLSLFIEFWRRRRLLLNIIFIIFVGGLVVVLLRNIFNFSFAPNHNKIPIFVRDTGVTGPGVGNFIAVLFHLLPHGCVLLTDLLNDAHAINVIEKDLSLPLPSIYVYFVIY